MFRKLLSYYWISQHTPAWRKELPLFTAGLMLISACTFAGWIPTLERYLVCLLVWVACHYGLIDLSRLVLGKDKPDQGVSFNDQS